jgi:hypothetical protein
MTNSEPDQMQLDPEELRPHPRAIKARRRVGSTPLARLRWLLNFVQMAKFKETEVPPADVKRNFPQLPSSGAKIKQVSFPKLSGGAEAALLREFETFASLAKPSEVAVSRNTVAGGFLPDVAARVHDDIESFLNGSSWDVHINQMTAVRIPGRPGRVHICDSETAFRLNASDLVGDYVARIKRCTSPRCRRLFVKYKRALYCSPRCSRRERMGRYINKQKKRMTAARRAELRERRHRYYENRIKRLLANNVKVGRRR